MAQIKLFNLLFLAGNSFGIIIKTGDVSTKKEVVTDVNNTVYNIAADTETGTLFFTESVAGHKEQLTFNVLKFADNTYEQIKEGFKGEPRGLTIDEKNKVIYLCTSEGIYKLNKETKIPVFFGQEGKDVVNVQYRSDVLYFVTSPTFKPSKYVWVNGEPKVEQVNITYATGLVVDSEGNIFYINEEKKLQKLSRGQSESVAITGAEELDFAATNIDNKDDFYFAAGSKGFVVNKGETEVKPLPPFAEKTITAGYVDQNQVTYLAEGNTIYKYADIK